MEAMTLEQIKDWHLKRAGLESSEKTAGMHARMAKALSAHLAQRAQAVDYTGRSAKDYAIEHAGYMARGATGLIDAINALELARQQFEEGDGSEDATNAAEQSLGDAMSALRNLIYEFEKRRDRALSVQKAGPVGDDLSMYECEGCGERPGKPHSAGCWTRIATTSTTPGKEGA